MGPSKKNIGLWHQQAVCVRCGLPSSSPSQGRRAVGHRGAREQAVRTGLSLPSQGRRSHAKKLESFMGADSSGCLGFKVRVQICNESKGKVLSREGIWFANHINKNP